MQCHIPVVTHMPRPTERWQCVLCKDVTKHSVSETLDGPTLHTAQRILLELYCNYEPSQPFRELVDPEVCSVEIVIKFHIHVTFNLYI